MLKTCNKKQILLTKTRFYDNFKTIKRYSKMQKKWIYNPIKKYDINNKHITGKFMCIFCIHEFSCFCVWIGGGIIKKASNRLFILGLLFSIIMGISGIYAMTTQVTDAQLGTSGVDIKLKILKLDNENNEVAYNDNEKRVMPAEIVSFIPKVDNLQESCYLRAKFYYINDSIDATNYITGFSNDWEKHGEYYYFNRVVNSKETIKLFDTIQIPNNIDQITNSSTIRLTITVEAIQDKNFTPAQAAEDPWNGIEPEESINRSYDINNDANITIKYENDCADDIKVPNNFLNDMKRIMPGDTFSDDITINNPKKVDAKYYLKFNLEKLNEDEAGLLKRVTLVITDKKGNIIYRGNIKDKMRILLGKYNKGDKDKLNFKVLVPNDLPNKYANLDVKQNWVFSVEYNKKKTDGQSGKRNPFTGDSIDVAITMFLLSSICLIIIMIIDYKRRKDVE